MPFQQDSEGNTVIPSGDFTQRSTMALQRNGSIGNAMLAINMRAVTIFGAFVAALASIVVTTYGAAVYIGQPRMERMVQEIVAPLILTEKLAEKRMDVHLLEIAGQVPVMMATQERIAKLEAEIDEIKDELRDMERRVE